MGGKQSKTKTTDMQSGVMGYPVNAKRDLKILPAESSSQEFPIKTKSKCDKCGTKDLTHCFDCGFCVPKNSIHCLKCNTCHPSYYRENFQRGSYKDYPYEYCKNCNICDYKKHYHYCCDKCSTKVDKTIDPYESMNQLFHCERLGMCLSKRKYDQNGRVKPS